MKEEQIVLVFEGHEKKVEGFDIRTHQHVPRGFIIREVSCRYE